MAEAASLRPPEQAAPVGFPEQALKALGDPKEVAITWSSIDSTGQEHEVVHYRIGPAIEIIPAIGDKPAVFRPGSVDASPSLSSGTVQLPDETAEFPTDPAALMRLPLQILHLPDNLQDAATIGIRTGSDLTPIAKLHASPTELRVNVGIGEWPAAGMDRRTLTATVLPDGSIKLSLTDLKDFVTTEKSDDEALLAFGPIIKSVFPGIFKAEEPQKPE
jgi:hypothetical protein